MLCDEPVPADGEELLRLAPYSVDRKPYGLGSDNSVSVLYYRNVHSGPDP
ncbi:hypothetical protein [Streptomyces sp. NPDC005476]